MKLKTNLITINKPIECFSGKQQDINNILKNIADSLIERLPKIQPSGLYEGKAGIVLYLFYYAKHFSLPKIDDAASEILAQICETPSESSNDLTFGKGLAGIGWLIEHLMQNEFIDCNTDEVLADLDQKFEQPVNLLDQSLKGGICGFGMYNLTRILNSKSKFYTDRDSKLKNNLLLIIHFLECYLPCSQDFVENEDFVDYSSSILFLCKILRDEVENSQAVVVLEKYIDYITKATTAARPASEWERLLNLFSLLTASYSVNSKRLGVIIKKNQFNLEIEQEEKHNNFGFNKGIAGKFHLYRLLSINFDNYEYKDTINYYMDLTISGLSKQWNEDKFSNEHYGLLNGLAGTGLVLLSAIAKTKLEWDSALLLN